MVFGDYIASLPVVKYILDNYSNHHDFHFWYPTYMKELVQFCFPEANVFGLDDKAKWKDGPTFTTMVKIPTYLRQHLTDYASSLVADVILEPHEKNYIKPDISKHKWSKSVRDYTPILRDRKYVIITTLYTSEVRAFRHKEINELSKWCVENGLYPVFCGKEETDHFKQGGIKLKGKVPDEVDFSVGLNLINKTSLLDFVKLADKAHSVVGLDNGLLHLAAMTDVHIAGGYTTVDPLHRLPYRNNQLGWNYSTVIPDESLECRLCQSRWTYDVKQDFTKCFYVQQGIDSSVKCCDQITAEKFIRILEKTL